MSRAPLLIVLSFNIAFLCAQDTWDSLNLPSSLLPSYISAHPALTEKCLSSPQCSFKENIGSNHTCFGYEPGCTEKHRYHNFTCHTASKWAKSVADQADIYWKAADFGIVYEKRDLMEEVCSPETGGNSRLVCEKNARHCVGENILIDLRKAKGTKAYDEDFLTKGYIGGRCSLSKSVTDGWEMTHRSFLQSWLHVMEDFVEMKEMKCDVTIEKPVYVLQMDAVVNMFHHFCDFVNLYVSQHLNHTTFSTDVQILTWETSGRGFSDPFGATFRAFTDHPVFAISKYFGKRVCLKHVVFALPPRQRLGLFYNMPLIDGCEGSGLFRAFNEHVIHRLKIKQKGPSKRKVRITILSRETEYRNIVNEQELIDALNANPKYQAKRVVYKFAQDSGDRDKNFMHQLETTHNTDIFIGMHGAGLTHMLFLPHWASVIELYHCDDPRCYLTLARLRGVKYFTWTNMKKLHPEDEGHHPSLGAHKKFTNYEFDVEEFLKLVKMAADHVTRHPEFRSARKALHSTMSPKDEL